MHPLSTPLQGAEKEHAANEWVKKFQIMLHVLWKIASFGQNIVKYSFAYLYFY